MNNYLANVDWNSLICFNPYAQSSWSALMREIQFAVEMFVPSYSISSRDGNHVAHSKRRRSLMVTKCASRKRMLWQKLQVNPHDSLARSKYKECIFEWRKLIRQDEMRAEQRIVDSCDLGAFYRHVNKRIANRSGTGAIVADDDKLLLDDADKANAFNRYFSSIGVVDNNVAPHCESLSIPECLDSIEISDDDVMSAIMIN